MRSTLFDSTTNRYRCTRCIKSSVHVLPKGGCKNDVVSLGHAIWPCGKFIFCVHCGSYSSGRLGLLQKECPKRATTDHFQRAKRWMLEGCHPESGLAIGKPMPWPVLPGSSCTEEVLSE